MSTAIKHLYRSSISDGEPIAGYIYRNQFGSGRAFVNEVSRAIGRTYTGKFSWLLPTKLDRIAEVFGDSVGCAKTLVERNTLFPVFTRFLPLKNRNLLQQHHHFNHVKGIGSIVGLQRLKQTGRIFGVCKHCIFEDLGSDGRSFWRREFLMPKIDFCWKHKERLNVGCAICILDHGNPQSILYVGKRCSCDVNRDTRLSSYTAEGISRLIDLAFGFSRLLDHEVLPGVEYDDFKMAIANRAIVLGLAKNGQVNKASTVDYFNDIAVESSRGKDVRFGISWDSLRYTLLGEELPSSPIISIQLLSALFGNWYEVERQLLQQSSIVAIPSNAKVPMELSTSVGTKSGSKRKSRHEEIFKARFPEMVLAYRVVRDRFPNESHTQLLLRLPSSSGKYLSRKRLISIGERLPPSKSGVDYYKSLDRSFEMHIRDKRELLRSTVYNPRISKNILLHGHRMSSIWARIEVLLPLSRSALLECEETYFEFRKRRLKGLVESGRVRTIQPLMSDVVNTLDDVEVIRLLKRARKKRPS